MSTRRQPRQTARRSVPVTAEQYEQLRDCACRHLPGTHQAGHCAAARTAGGAR